MNLDKLGRTLGVIAAVAILAMVLQGCGGDNGSGISQDMYDTLMMEKENLQDMYDTLMMEKEDLEGQIGMIDDDAAGTSLYAQLNAAKAEVADLKGQLKDANDELAEIRQDAADAMAAVALADRIAREAAIRTAIGTNRVRDAEKPLPDATSGATAVAATRDAAGAVAIDVNGADDDVYAGGAVTADASGWTSATLTMTDAVTEATDTLMIYTDIEAPADKLFTDQYTQAQLDDALDATTVANAQSSGFPSTAGTTWEYTGAEGERAKTVTGTFDGVPGQFTCTGATCSVTADGDGDLTESDGWRFTPDAPNTATVKDPDTAYAYFGWWLNMPKDNTAVHDVEVFAGGTTDHAANVTNEIEGTATYSGPAAGRYVTKTYTAGVQTDAGVGQFTATANLTAQFGAADAPGTIGGAVSGFMLDGNTSADWTVVLEDADLTDDAATFNGLSEVNFGGGLTDGATPAGTWQGSFYADADATDDTNAPGTVAGTFDAVTDNAAVIGGFGATK